MPRENGTNGTVARAVAGEPMKLENVPPSANSKLGPTRSSPSCFDAARSYSGSRSTSRCAATQLSSKSTGSWWVPRSQNEVTDITAPGDDQHETHDEDQCPLHVPRLPRATSDEPDSS